MIRALIWIAENQRKVWAFVAWFAFWLALVVIASSAIVSAPTVIQMIGSR